MELRKRPERLGKPGIPAPARPFRLRRDRSPQTQPASGKQRRIRRIVTFVEHVQKSAVPPQFGSAGAALRHMAFDALFHIGRHFAIAVERNLTDNFRTVHTNASRLALIFCVARNRQFLAASSVVPIISPMARSRNPS